MATSAKRSKLNTPVQKDEWQIFFKKLGRVIQMQESIINVIPIWDLSPSVYFLFDCDQPEHQDQSDAELSRQMAIVDDSDQSAFDRFSAAVKWGLWAAETYSVRVILAEFPQLNTDTPDSHNLSLLHICAIRSCGDDHNYCRIAEFLVQTGCDVNRTSSNGQVTPLMVAVNQGHTCMVKCLLTLGADPNRFDWRHKSALSIAALHPRDRQSAVDQLLIFGADYTRRELTFCHRTPIGLVNGRLGKNGAIRAFEFVQKKIDEMMLLRVISAAKTELKQFHLVQPLHPTFYQSVELEEVQNCWAFPITINRNRHPRVTSNDQFLLLIGTVEWRKVGDERDILSGFDLHQLNLNPPELIGKAKLNGIPIATSTSDRATIKIKPIEIGRTQPYQIINDVVCITLANRITQRKPIVMVAQIWEVERQIVQV